jgi:hypothetical protein
MKYMTSRAVFQFKCGATSGKDAETSYVHQQQEHENVDQVKEFVLEKRKNH